MTAATIAVSSGSCPSPSTNDLSILSSSNGKRFKYASDERPVPKSSIEMATRSPHTAWERSFLMSMGGAGPGASVRNATYRAPVTGAIRGAYDGETGSSHR
jgi:hypothetical protein